MIKIAWTSEFYQEDVRRHAPVVTRCMPVIDHTG